MKNKKALAFDVDGCLVVTKQPMSDVMADMVAQLLDKYEIMVISGCPWNIFENNLVKKVQPRNPNSIHRFHLLPTCGTTYYKHDGTAWQQLYYEGLDDNEIDKINRILERHAKKLGFWVDNPTGVIIENRGSQVTYSALGQDALPEHKHAWDPDHSRKQKLYEAVVNELSEFDVKVGGTTSIDVTKPGMDKSYGMRKFMDINNLKKNEIIYFGDMLHESGNDYPIKAMGIDAIAVEHPDHTLEIIRDYL